MALEERRAFDPAKEKEMNNYIVNEVLGKLEDGDKPPAERILNMCWVLGWRIDEDTGDNKPKARLVILGYMGPDYEHRPAASPTMARNTRQLILQLGAWMGFSAATGDVSGAVIQGRGYVRELCVLPVPKVAVALGVAPGMA